LVRGWPGITFIFVLACKLCFLLLCCLHVMVKSDCEHECFLYKLGIYNSVLNISRNCSHHQVHVAESLSLSPWWFSLPRGSKQKQLKSKVDKDKDKTTPKWPLEPPAPIFERVHRCTEDEPWCTYVLKQSWIKAASSLSGDDQKLFCYYYCQYAEIFSNDPYHLTKVRYLAAEIKKTVHTQPILLPSTIAFDKVD